MLGVCIFDTLVSQVFSSKVDLMRLLRLSTAYPTYLKKFYADRPGLCDQPFVEQRLAMIGEPYRWNNLWTLRFAPLGYEVLELVCNAGPMQRRWAAEHGLSYSENGWVPQIAAAQVEAFRPDIVVRDDYGVFTHDFFRSIRQRCSSIRLTIGWCGAPYESIDMFRGYDLMLTNLRPHLEAFRAAGIRVELVRHCFDPWWLEQVGQQSKRRIPFSFCGSVVKRSGFHNRREQLLLYLLRNTDLRVFADLPVRCAPLTLKQRCSYSVLRAVQRMPGGSKLIASIPRVAYLANQPIPKPSDRISPLLVRRTSPPVFGREMFQTLHDSEITLNTHIDLARDNASNMRLFEATGVGTCLLTEHQSDLADLFEPDVEVATYRNPEEAAEKATYLREHEEARRSMAAAGQKRVLREHTFAHRSRQIDELIRQSI